MHSLIQDVRFALRMIFKHPVQNGAIVLILALGIAANTAMFAGFDAWVLRPLAFADPETLVTLSESQPKLGSSDHGISAANLHDWRQQSRTLSEIAPFQRQRFNFRGEDEPERVSGASISANLFPMLGIEPANGRGFLPAEDLPDGHRVALISHRIWETRFDSDPQILGRKLLLDDEVTEIVGVMEPGFAFPEWAEVWTPLRLDPEASPRDERSLSAIGRLADGASIAEAQSEIQAIAARLEQLYPETNTGWSVEVLPVRREWVPPVIRVALTASMGAAVFVLLTICANVANLMLAQATGRRRETALRAALGAGGQRLIRQALTESTLLALAAGALGTVLSQLGMRWMVTWVPVEVPYLFRFELDERAIFYTLTVAIVAGVVCALAPVLRNSGIDLVEALKSGGRAGEGPGASRTRSLFVVCELAFSMLLSIGALLMVQSFLNQQSFDTGYRTRDVLTLRLSLTGKAFSEPAARIAFFDRALLRLAELPMVETAGAANHLPASRSGWEPVRLEVEGRPSRPGEEPATTLFSVTDDYLETLDLPLTAGRAFTRGEMQQGGEVALVSTSLAERLWPGESPLNRRIRLVNDGENRPWRTVVGVVGHIDPGYEMVDFGNRPRSQLYLPYAAQPSSQMTLTVRGGDLEPLAAAVRGALREVDVGVPISDVQSIQQAIHEVQWVSRYFSQLFALYAMVALAIAALGAYGVIADSVNRRKREMGIRLAMGARPRDILRMVVFHQGLRLGFLGVALGLMLALPVTRMLSSMLYEVSPYDPLIFGGVGALLTAVAFFASLLPAHQASRVDPIRVLRFE